MKPKRNVGEIEMTKRELEESLKVSEQVAWANFETVQMINEFLIENDLLVTPYEGDHKAVAMNIIESIKLLLVRP